MEREELLKKVKETILRVEPGAEIILYGSRARGDARPDSDWDFLVLVDGPVDQGRKDRIRDALYDLELECREVLTSLIISRDAWDSSRYRAIPLRHAVEREGRPIG